MARYQEILHHDNKILKDPGEVSKIYELKNCQIYIEHYS